MDTKGGRYSMTINGQVFSGRTAAKLMLAGVSPTTGVNQDGTAYRTVAPKLVGVDLNFDRGLNVAWNSAMMLADVDVTFVEDDFGVTHMFTSAAYDGEPTIDSATGEVTGVKVMTSESNYTTYTT